MIITDACVFLPVPHCAGGLVRDVLFECGPVRHIARHGRLDQIPAEHAGKPVFSVIRHPLEWYLSVYHGTWRAASLGKAAAATMGYLGLLVRSASANFSQPFNQSMRNLYELGETNGSAWVNAILSDDRVSRDDALVGAYKRFYTDGGGLMGSVVAEVATGLDSGVSFFTLENIRDTLPDALALMGYDRDRVAACMDEKQKTNAVPRRFADSRKHYHPRSPFPAHFVKTIESAIFEKFGYA